MHLERARGTTRATSAATAARMTAGALLALSLGCAEGREGTTPTTGSGGGGGATSSQASGGGDATSATSTSSTGDGGGGASTASSTSATTSVTTATSSSSSTGTGGAEPIAEVFAHTATTLYRVDLETNDIAPVGELTGCDDDLVDIALDKDSNIYGTTYGTLWRIDKETAACTALAEGDFPNSLSFVPAGTLDPTEEALVGYVGADYVRIDIETGEVDTIQTDALTNGLISSGDIVSVIDGPTLLTVKGGACEDTDCLLEIDPLTGESLENYGTTTYNNVFGVAFWDGSLFGFTSTGEAFEFVADGNGGFDPVSIPVGAGLTFYGAGSTTSAPKGVLD